MRGVTARAGVMIIAELGGDRGRASTLYNRRLHCQRPPNVRKHIVCLTFDFDAISGLIARGQTTPSWLSRGEFGPRVGAPRLLALFARYGIATSWYVPGHTIETFPASVEAVVAGGHEIAHHGWTHRPPATLTREEEERELVRGNEAIKRISGQTARGYRSPSWALSPHSVELMLKHGFVYDSSMMGDDYTPYRVRRGDVITVDQPAVWGKPCRLTEMPISWSLDDYPHFEFIRTRDWILPGLRNYNGVLANWTDDFTYMTKAVRWGVLTYTFHPFVIGRAGRMLLLEKLIRRLKDGGAVFTTLADAAAEYATRVPFGD